VTSCICIGCAALGAPACSSGSTTGDAAGADAADDGARSSPVDASMGEASEAVDAGNDATAPVDSSTGGATDATDVVDARDDAAPPVDSSTGDASGDAATAEAGLDASVCVAPSPMNLVQNPGLDTDTSHWNPPSVLQVTWSPRDATNCSTSGSIVVENLNDAGINNGALQCIPVTAGTTYNFGGRMFIPSAGYHGQVALDLGWFTGTNCQGTIRFDPFLYASASYDTWQSVSKDSLVAPAGAQSAQIELAIDQGTGSGFAPSFDMIYLSTGGAHF
jgi:hypothetical protein